MEFVHDVAVAAGFAVSLSLSWIAWELRAQRIDRRALEAERQVFEAERIRRDTTNACGLLEAMRLADAAERRRRARDQEHHAAARGLIAAVRTLLGHHDTVTSELMDEIRQLTRAIAASVVPSRPPPSEPIDAELLAQRRPVISPPPSIPQQEATSSSKETP